MHATAPTLFISHPRRGFLVSSRNSKRAANQHPHSGYTGSLATQDGIVHNYSSQKPGNEDRIFRLYNERVIAILSSGQ